MNEQSKENKSKENTTLEEKPVRDGDKNHKESQKKGKASVEKSREEQNHEEVRVPSGGDGRGKGSKGGCLSEVPWKDLGWSWIHAAIIVAVSFAVALGFNWIRGSEHSIPLKRRRPFDIYTDCPEVLDDIPTVKAEKLPRKSKDAKGVVFVDSRKGPAFCRGHIPGAWYVPAYATDPPDSSVLSKLKKLKGRWVVVYGDKSVNSANRLATTLINAGVRGVKTLEGDLEAWKNDKRKISTCPSKVVRVSEVPKDEKKTVFVDARGEGDFEESRIPGALWIPDDDLLAPDPQVLEKLSELVKERKDALIVVYDSGKTPEEGDMEYKAKNTAAELKARGYKNVGVLEGGLDGWKKAGGSLRKGDESSD